MAKTITSLTQDWRQKNQTSHGLQLLWQEVKDSNLHTGIPEWQSATPDSED